MRQPRRLSDRRDGCASTFGRDAVDLEHRAAVQGCTGMMSALKTSPEAATTARYATPPVLLLTRTLRDRRENGPSGAEIGECCTAQLRRTYLEKLAKCRIRADKTQRRVQHSDTGYELLEQRTSAQAVADWGDAIVHCTSLVQIAVAWHHQHRSSIYAPPGGRQLSARPTASCRR
jgi:hypothetical protein